MVKHKKNNIQQLLFGLIIIVLINIIGSYLFIRIDLTQEKRHTISDVSKELLSDLDDIVYFRVYLEGEFPAGFKRLRNSTKEMLDEFRAYSNNIEYEFINPVKKDDPATTKNLYKQLVSKGLEPTNLHVNNTDGKSQQMIFPGLIAVYRGKEIPVQLLKSQLNESPEIALNNSIQALEFNISSAIKKLTTRVKPSIAFIFGHGELDENYTGDIAYGLSEYYSLARVNIDGKINSLTERLDNKSGKPILKNKFDAIIIAQPDSAFSEKDKYIIDQFIMRGGKALWLIDPVFASMDSLQTNVSTLGIPLALNLEDMLFNYGVRINTNLLLDLNALPIPLKTGMMGGQPRFEFFPWHYFPVITPTSKHPIVNNLNAIKTEFVSDIDIVGSDSLKKTVLLHTSDYTKIMMAPVHISLNMIKETPDERLFNQSFKNIAVLIEGKFSSVFKNRPLSGITNNVEFDFRKESKETAMIIVSDGDIIKNQIQIQNGKVHTMPLGYDKYTRKTFGNKDFILNAMNYLCNNSRLVEIRSRELKIRLLNKTKIAKQRLLWQLINVVLPVLLIVIFGVFTYIIRKKRFTS